MIVFLFYLTAICLLFTVCAAIADAIGHFHPDWQAEADESLEDASPTRERDH